MATSIVWVSFDKACDHGKDENNTVKNLLEKVGLGNVTEKGTEFWTIYELD